MQSIEEMKAQQARELAALEAKHKLAALMPLAPSYVAADTATGTPRVSYKVQGLAGALEVLQAFTVVPFTEYRDGFLHLKPIAFCKGIDADKHADQWGASIVAETSFTSNLGYPLTTIKVKFFARIPGLELANGVVHVTLNVTGPDYIGAFNVLGASCQYTSNNRSQVKAGSIRPNAALNGAGRLIAWSIDSNSAHHEYLINSDFADQDATGNKELSHLYATLQNLADEFDNKVTK